MTAEQDVTPLTERKVVRRGLIAGLAGFGAAALFKITGTGKAEADGEPLLRGVVNGIATELTEFRRHNSSGPTLVVRNEATSGSFNHGDAIQAATDKGAGLYVAGVRGIGQGTGVIGEALDTGVGVLGRAGGLSIGDATIARGSIGVDGQALNATGIGTRGANSGNGTGVYGVSNSTSLSAVGDGSGTGVHGKTGTGDAVLGQATAASAPAAFGVRGVVAGNGTGVRGVSNTGGDTTALGNGSGIGVEGRSGSGPGVHGASVSGLGVRGVSPNFVGVVGISDNSHGLYGFTASPAAVGLVGENLGGGLAGYFNGNVQVTGTLFVNGNKAAVIPMYDGTRAMVYCQESPEPWFEDFGRAQLVGGVANVTLEREFATLVAGGNYHVFTEAEGDTRGLYVSRRTPAGFEVREVQGGTGSVAFSYRVVTRRKDIEGKRFARVIDEQAKNLQALRAGAGVMDGRQTPNTPSQPAPPFVPPPVSPQPPATMPPRSDGR